MIRFYKQSNINCFIKQNYHYSVAKNLDELKKELQKYNKIVIDHLDFISKDSFETSSYLSDLKNDIIIIKDFEFKENNLFNFLESHGM